ncbi:transglycosylase SLT domain-containing protein [Prauserella oleivorans]
MSQGALGDDEQPASAAKASPASAENAAVVREHTQFGVAQPADQARSEADAKAAAPAAKAAGQGGAAQSKSDGGKKVAEVAQPKPAAQPKAAPAPQAAPKPAPAPAPKPAPAPAGDRVDRWIHQAIVIMKSKGVPVSHADKDEIRTVIEKESSGDPKAINLWDSNAEKGTPSKGLMQTIDPTFDAHKLPGHDDIYNPVDNIIAGVRYTLDRYGSFDEHPGLASMSDGGDYQGY